ncbi:MAG: T9SS type A sorting domain-containing protein [Candidatus Marinimicrobia bacterium]|nr:T9SS type A sorting domain-containing protein [Candidatus Neomarinimicrobiota bacterium]
MRKFTLFLTFFCATMAFSQVVYTVPEFATVNDSIVLYFDAAQAERQDLKGYSGEIYTHTGVNTNKGNWQHVIGTWGNNSTQPRLERVDTDLYKLTIGYPLEFYNITQETVQAMCFVFRSADASRQTEDIFYTFFHGGITVVIDSPSVSIPFGDMRRNPLFYHLDDEIGFKIKVATIGVDVDYIHVYKNSELVGSVTGSDSLAFSETAVVAGMYNYQIIASDVDGVKDTIWFSGVVLPEIAEEPLPQGVQPGTNLMEDGTVVLSLFAPYKEFVYIIGNFNDWKVDNEYLMKKYSPSEDSVMFWLQLNDIDQNVVYQYQYLIDGEIRVADHYTPYLLDPWNDAYIDAVRFPGLPEYPTGKTEHYVSVFENKSSEFEWTDPEYIRPDKEKLVIYETLLRDFTSQQSYAGMLEKLDYLDSLGVNVIELMPVNEFEGNLSWGYNPAYYFAVDKYYGTPEALKNFVNECHRRDLAVVMDVVYNHAFGSNGMARMYLENGRPGSENPWFNPTAPHTDYSWGYDFNHESIHTQSFLDRVNRFWIEEYHIDGFRFDFTRGFTNKSGGSGPYDASRIQILKRMADKIREVDPGTYIILEHLVDSNDEMKALADYGMLLWGNMNHDYNEAAMGYSSDFSWGYYKTRNWNAPNLVTYMESHDEERLMYKNLQYGNRFGDYDIQELSQALQRQKLVNAFFLTLPGPKMIWQFGELGYDYSIDYNGRLGEKPLRWDYFDEPNRRNLFNTVKELIKLRQTYDVFTSKNTTVNLNVAGTVKQIKMTGSKNIHIVGNFGVTQNPATLNFVHGGTWHDFFSGDTMKVDGDIQMDLEPGEFHIFSDSKLFLPKTDVLVGINERPVVSKEFEVYPAYPNPFNPETTIRFYLPEKGFVRYEIYNLLGQIVDSEKFTDFDEGYNKITWNAGITNTLSSGIYYFNIIYRNNNYLSKIILLK